MNALMQWIQSVSLALILVILGSSEAWAQRQSIDETRQVSPNEKIRLEVMRGEVRIRTNTQNIFSVNGLLDEDATGFDLESSNGFSEFIVRMPRRVSGGLFTDGSELEISVPVNSDIEFTGVNVNVDVQGVQGGARIRTVNGAINAADLGTFVDLNTVNGAINSVNNSGRVEITTVNGSVDERGSSGRVSIEAVNGRIDVDSAAEIVALQVVNGRIRGRVQSVQELDLETVNGGIELDLTGSPAPRVSGSTVSGHIELDFDANVNARFSLRSNTGARLVNQLTDDEPSRDRFGPSRRLDFTMGDGIGDVRLTSISGRLELRRR